MPDETLAQTSAPGKLVLSGEYAVLAGAPAVVAAIDRRVACRIDAREAGGWAFRSRGFDAASRHRRDALPDVPGDPGALAGYAIRRLGIQAATLPEHLDIETDSRPCYHDGAKLGLGSSAAAVVAIAGAMARIAGTVCTLPQSLAIHRDLQGGSGSGLDVAAAFRGGVIRYQAGETRSMPWSSSMGTVFVYVGWSTETRDFVQRFNDWRRDGEPSALRRLVECAKTVAEGGGSFLDALAEYADALDALDRAAGIGIFSEAHRAAMKLGRRHHVLYKPCGAGGGDMGVALSEDVDALGAFRTAVTQAGLHVVSAAIDPDGLSVS